MKKTLRADEIISILEAPLNLSWRRRKDWDINVASDPAKHLYPRIVRLEREASVRELLRALETAPTPRSRHVILGVLGRRQAKSAVPTILGYLSNRSWRVRNEAADALKDIGDVDDPEVGHSLLERIDGKEQREGIRSTLALALAAVGYRPAIPALMRSLDSNNEVVRRCAASALNTLGATEAVGALHRAIEQESDSHTKIQLVRYLDQILSATI